MVDRNKFKQAVMSSAGFKEADIDEMFKELDSGNGVQSLHLCHILDHYLTWVNCLNNEEAEPDANLISAAHDLFKALQILLGAVECHAISDDPELVEAKELSISAIAKAKDVLCLK